MSYNLEKMHPSSGRFITEDGDTINIADILEDIFLAAGFVKTVPRSTTTIRLTEVTVSKGHFIAPYHYAEGTPLPLTPLANRHTVRIKYRNDEPVKVCNQNGANGFYYTLEPMVEYVFTLDPSQEVPIFAVCDESCTVEVIEEA